MAFSSSITAWFERKYQLVFFVLGLLCTLPLVFITPPFQVPDEPQHFYKAYAISELNFIASLSNNRGGDLLPSSLIDLSSHYLDSREIHASRPVVSRPFSSLAKGFQIPLEADRREFIDFTGAAFYSPIPYLPQAAGIALGRYFGCGPLALMYLARFINAIIAIFLISLAIRLVPAAKLAFLVVSLLPMSVYLFGSLSPDALVIASAYIFIALAFHSYLKAEWQLTDVLIAILCGIVFCSIKVVYAPLLLLAAPVILIGKQRIKSLLAQFSIIAIPILTTAIWLHSVSGLVVPAKIGTDMAAQMHHVMTQPLYFLEAVIHGFLWNKFYFFTTIGTLGWLTVTLPAISYILPIIAISIAFFTYPVTFPAISIRMFLWWSVLGCACIFLVMLALYCYWTPVAAVSIDGVQGRYFLPLLPILAMVGSGLIARLNLNFSTIHAQIWVCAIISLEACLTFSSLLQAYWKF